MDDNFVNKFQFHTLNGCRDYEGRQSHNYQPNPKVVWRTALANAGMLGKRKVKKYVFNRPNVACVFLQLGSFLSKKKKSLY